MFRFNVKRLFFIKVNFVCVFLLCFKLCKKYYIDLYCYILFFFLIISFFYKYMYVVLCLINSRIQFLFILKLIWNFLKCIMILLFQIMQLNMVFCIYILLMFVMFFIQVIFFIYKLYLMCFIVVLVFYIINRLFSQIYEINCIEIYLCVLYVLMIFVVLKIKVFKVIFYFIKKKNSDENYIYIFVFFKNIKI